ncbi:MAG: class I SAM-dependent methyltransferase [Microscillaceae bacterium]
MEYSYQAKQEIYYADSRPEILPHVPPQVRKVLDVGCASGNFAAALKNYLGAEAEIWGIEMASGRQADTPTKMDVFLEGTCEEKLPEVPDGYFDLIVFNDVLEHLVNPWEVLKTSRTKLNATGMVLSSIPNVRYFRNFGDLIFRKKWAYAHNGVMDWTHLRFFTKSTIEEMYRSQGYEIVKMQGINPSKSIRPFLVNIPLFFTFYDIRYLQFLTLARPRK